MFTIDINETAEYYISLLDDKVAPNASKVYAETEIRPRLTSRGWDVVPIDGTTDHRLIYIGEKVA